MKVNWFDDDNEISQIITSEYCSRFKNDPNFNINKAVPLPRDILEEDDIFLTREATVRGFAKTVT